MLHLACRFAALIALLMGMAAPAAASERLVVSLSRHQVLVTSSFTGTSIVLFGSVERDEGRLRSGGYDIVATVRGPIETVMVRRKERVLGIWANVGSREFVKVPTYLAVLASRPFDQIASPEEQRRWQLGLDYILLPQRIGPDIADVVPTDPYRMSFIRLQNQQGLYVQRPNGVTFLTPALFRGEVPLPATAPIGTYEVEVKLFADGELVTQSNSAFELVKVGFEQFVATAARDYGLLYGIATALMALMTGWLASVVFRRD